MNFKKSIVLCISMVLVLALTGCGERFPELSEEEYNKTVEYAVGVLMKHSNNGQNKMVYVDAKALEKEKQKQEAEEAKAQQEKEQQKPQPQPAPQPETNPEPEDIDNPAELASGEETGEPDENTETEGKTSSYDPSAITISADQPQEIIPDIFLSYQGYSVSSTYPESSKSYVVNADKGKRLLVLRFDLYNASDSSQDVNLIPHNILFEILLNGRSIGYSSVTFLPNDLSSYSGTIDSKAHESVVVLTQIDEKEAKMIDTLGLIVTLDGETQTVILE